MGEGSADPYAYCADLVRAGDPERATAALFAPADRQGDLMALAAFDLESAAIPSLVSQPLPGEIRLQWWRDLFATGEGAGGSPVAEALLRTVERHALPVELLDRFLDALIFDLYDDGFATLADLETYAGETQSTLLGVGARVLGSPTRGAVADAAGHGGVALTVLKILRLADAAPARAGKFVPDALLDAAGATREDWAVRSPAGLQAATALVALGREHLAEALNRLPEIERGTRPAFLPLVTLARRLDAARAALGGEAVRPVGPLGRSFAYWRAMRRQ